MNLTKKFLRVIAFVLFAVIALQLPVVALARELQPGITDNAISTTLSGDDAHILSEDATLRDEYTKHFVLSDGSMLAASYSVPVHYYKNDEWKFGMKCHIGVGAGSGLVHTMTVTAANGHDITQTANLLREDDKVVYGDSGYLGVQKRSEIANNKHFSNIDFRINRRPSSLPRVSDNAIDWERYIENRKSSVRCKVEYTFRIIKCQFGYKKTVYPGIEEKR